MEAIPYEVWAARMAADLQPGCDCPPCKGTGSVTEACESCGHEHEEDCEICGGLGYLDDPASEDPEELFSREMYEMQCMTDRARLQRFWREQQAPPLDGLRVDDTRAARALER